jgi:hypothetical protein
VIETSDELGYVKKYDRQFREGAVWIMHETEHALTCF